MKWHVLWAAATAAACIAAGTANAGDPKPFPDFTFKRVGLPAPGSKRINVQIDPAEQRAAAAAADPAEGAEAAASRPSGFEWFWSTVSPDAVDAGPANLKLAMGTLAGAANAPAPRLQHLADIAGAHGVDILLATVGTDVSPALALAVIGVESSGRADAVSSAGAEGLMQLMPDTAKRFGVTDSADAAQNIRGGVAYLDWLMKEFGRDPILALAGYNAGENAVKSHEGVPPYAETRAYVPKVLAAWRVARGLCMTPPELVTDPCVFAVQSRGKNG